MKIKQNLLLGVCVFLFGFLIPVSKAVGAGSVIVSYELSKNIYSPGDEGSIMLIIQNPTTFPITRLKVDVTSGNWIKILGKNEFSIDSLPAGASQRTGIVFAVNSTPFPTISWIYVHLSYKDYTGEKREEDVVIPVTILNLPLLEIRQTGNNEVKIGGKAKICVELFNHGHEAKNVLLIINTTRPEISITPSQIYLGDIAQKKLACFNISLSPLIQPGIYVLPLVVKYTDALHLKEYASASAAFIKAKGTSGVMVYIENPELKEGENMLEITIANTGTEKIHAVWVEIGSQSIKVYPKKIFIGELDRDDYDSESIKVDGQSGRHTITITVHFRDAFEKEHTQTFSLEISIPEEKKNENPLIENKGLYVGALLLIVILIILLLRKKR